MSEHWPGAAPGAPVPRQVLQAVRWWASSPMISTTTFVQVALQVVPLGGSHCSVPWTKPSPQAGFLQARVQAPVLLLALPRSHSSVPLTMPSPQPSTRQVDEQPSLLLVLLSSQVSGALVTPSPQTMA